MLIKLTAVQNPSIDGGRSEPCFIDASRVVAVQRARLTLIKDETIKARERLADNVYAAAVKLWDTVGTYLPNMSDPVAVRWMQEARETASKVTQAHEIWQRCHRQLEANHPPVMCTEIQLACGATFSEGVMVSRVWVTESPEEVAHRVLTAPRPFGYMGPGPVGT
jgi:hypothetical protein